MITRRYSNFLADLGTSLILLSLLVNSAQAAGGGYHVRLGGVRWDEWIQLFHRWVQTRAGGAAYGAEAFMPWDMHQV